MSLILRKISDIKKQFPNGIDRLEFGSGNTPEPGYVHLDIQGNLSHLEILSDVRNTPIPNNFVKEEIRAVHLMEHFCHPDFSSSSVQKEIGTTLEVLKEAYRILKPGGKLKIVTPDFEKICHSVTFKEINFDYLQQWMFGGHQNNYDIHHWVWSHADAHKWFTKTGFRKLSDFSHIKGKRAFKIKWLLKLKKIYQPPHPLWIDAEWYHWLFFEGTK